MTSMMETREYYFDDRTLPIVYEPAAASRAHGHRDFLEYLLEHKEELLDGLHNHGSLLFRAFSIEGAREFQDVVRIFTPKLLSYTGGDSPRSAVADQVYTSTSYPASLPMSLHNEMSYTRDYPSLIAFYCETAPEADGETPLADCRRVLSSLSPAVIDRFRKKRIRYIQNLHAGIGLGRSWRDAFETDDKKEIETILERRGAEFYWKNDGSLHVSEVIEPIVVHPRTGASVFFSQAHQWHVSGLDKKTREALLKLMKEEDLYHSCTYGDGSPIGEDELNEVRCALDAATIKFPWQKNDLLIVDNILVAHGRRPFKGARRILVAMG